MVKDEYRIFIDIQLQIVFFFLFSDWTKYGE